uniref:dihydroxyacetone kinase subunit DhaK n=1 Tax=Ornithinimicrobium sp. CNJ-824 TaxID=1904966 RepID=UPI00315836BB
MRRARPQPRRQGRVDGGRSGVADGPRRGCPHLRPGGGGDGAGRGHPRRARPGAHRVAPAREVAAALVEPVVADLDLRAGDQVLCLVNGLGGTPIMELYLMHHEVHALLDRAGIRVARALVGNYITSLEMAGCTVTLLRADDDVVRLWDAPVATPGLRWGS